MGWVPAESQECWALDLPTAYEHDFSSWSIRWASSSSPGFWEGWRKREMEKTEEQRDRSKMSRWYIVKLFWYQYQTCLLYCLKCQSVSTWVYTLIRYHVTFSPESCKQLNRFYTAQVVNINDKLICLLCIRWVTENMQGQNGNKKKSLTEINVFSVPGNQFFFPTLRQQPTQLLQHCCLHNYAATGNYCCRAVKKNWFPDV